jgi:hypothetical protein
MAFEVVASGPLILFFVADHRLDRVPSFEPLLQCASGLALVGDVNFDIFRVTLFAAVTAINECFPGPDAGLGI